MLYFIFPTACEDEVKHPRFMLNLHYLLKGAQTGLGIGVGVGLVRAIASKGYLSPGRFTHQIMRSVKTFGLLGCIASPFYTWRQLRMLNHAAYTECLELAEADAEAAAAIEENTADMESQVQKYLEAAKNSDEFKAQVRGRKHNDI
jgi:hypothetical protein